MTSLKDLQARFQMGIVDGDDAILSDVQDSPREKRTVLFGVYRNAYVARLAEILGHDYEITHAYVGDATFSKLAKRYIAAHPSDQRNARWFGRHLPEFAKTTAPFSNHPQIAEIAALEKALADAFDGPDAPVLSMDDLAAVPPEDWAFLTFTSHPTVERLRVTTNAADIWSALSDENPPPDLIHLPEPQSVIVWRQELMAHYRPFHAEEAMMWNEAVKGVRFGVLCEMVATFAGEDEAGLRAATYLKSWIDAGMLTAFALDAPQPASSGAGNKALERPVSQ